MKLEEITQSRIRKTSNSELFGLRLRAIQLYEKYLEVEKREPLVNIDWDVFYKNYKLLTNEFDKRSLNFTRRSIDKVLEKAKYFGIKIIEKHGENIPEKEKCFAILAQIGKSNILINPVVKKEQVSEPINGIIITKSALPSNNWGKIKDFPMGVPVYAIGKAFDKIDFREKHLFIKSLKIGKNQALIRPIKIMYEKKSPTIGLLVSQKDTKLSILPEFLSLTKSAQELIRGTVWICEVKKYDKDDEQNEQICFLSLAKMARELKPKKIFLVNIGEDLLEHKDEVNQELKKWQGRILGDGDILEQDEIMRGIVWEINEDKNRIASLDEIDSITKYMKDRAVAEVDFNGIRTRIEKKGKDISIMINPDIAEGSPLKSKLLPLQVDEIGSFRDDFVGEGTIVAVDDEKNQCLGEEVVKNFLSQHLDNVSDNLSNSIHIFISDLLKMNGKDIGEWTLEKRKKMMNCFGNREHVHFVKPVGDLEKNALSYIVDIHAKEEIQKVFRNITKVSDEGKFYPKDIAKGIVIKCFSCPYIAKKIVISKPETTENYHRIPVTDCKITATMTLSAEKGIKALYCGGTKQIATYLFDINKWTMSEAQAWVKDQLKKAMHKRTECMECNKPPVYECLWAEGIGHAWFCKEHFKEWSTNGDGKGEIISVKEVKNGEASKKFGDNSNPNIIKELIKEDAFDCICTECGKEIKSAVDCKNVKCPDCGSEMRTKGQPSPEKTEKVLNKSEVKFDFKKIDNTEFIVGGIVYYAGKVDSQGDFSRKGEIWKALKLYMRKKGNIKIMHSGDARNIPIIESYLVESETFKGGHKEENKLNAGDWWLSVYLGDPENLDIWNDVKSGKLTGWSMGGRANSIEGHV